MKGHLRKRGASWELRAFAGRDPVTGREVYRTATFRGGKRDAEDALAKFVQEVAGAHTSRDAMSTRSGSSRSRASRCGSVRIRWAVCLRWASRPQMRSTSSSTSWQHGERS